jgi:hypothetical protein
LTPTGPHHRTEQGERERLRGAALEQQVSFQLLKPLGLGCVDVFHVSSFFGLLFLKKDKKEST